MSTPATSSSSEQSAPIKSQSDRLQILAAVPDVACEPVKILQEQNATRLPHLVPVRTGRMLQSRFAFFRGAAAVMAADLAATRSSGVHVLCCGDAHAANYGFYASPERELLFDLNDFDEAGVAPWEWDLKRLTASIYIAAGDNGESEDDARTAAKKSARGYRKAVEALSASNTMERFYYSVDTTDLLEIFDSTTGEKLNKTIKKARKRTSERTLKKLTVEDSDANRRIADQPPLTTHVNAVTPEQMRELIVLYLLSASPEISYLLRNFKLMDSAVRVVGVGSVGTRCFLSYLEDERNQTPLFLQVKEAQSTVLSSYGKIEQALDGLPWGEYPENQGRRVVASQKILQSHSDPFLGWGQMENGIGPDGRRLDFYVRQFKDMKGSIDLTALNAKELGQVGAVCAAILARAHSQSTGFAKIAEWIDDGKEFDKALANFSADYAKINEADYQTLKAAVDRGEIEIITED